MQGFEYWIESRNRESLEISSAELASTVLFGSKKYDIE